MTDSEQKFRPLNSVAIFKWHVKLVTPMLIRSTHNLACWSHSKIVDKKQLGKSRGRNMSFDKVGGEKVRDKIEYPDGYSGIGLPFFRLEIDKDGKVVPKYHIPVSSIRGAMRSWTIHNLVDYANWDNSSEYDSHIKELFGDASESDDSDSEPTGRAGRFRFTGGKILTPGTQAPDIQGNDWILPNDKFDFKNAPRHIKIRNPIDRITMASKDGGLHSFIEFSRDMEFEVRIELREPEDPFDYQLMATIKGEINSGMLRFGALSSVGRGRVEIVSEENETRTLRNSSDSSDSENSNDVLAFLYKSTPFTLKAYSGKEVKSNA